MQCKTDSETGRVIYRCHNNFGPLDPSGLGNIYPQITDFGAATLLGTGGDDGAVQLGTRPIQPDYYRAPEVILGCGWSYSADIWNLGVMVRTYMHSKKYVVIIKYSRSTTTDMEYTRRHRVVHPGTGCGGNLPPRSTSSTDDSPAWAPA